MEVGMNIIYLRTSTDEQNPENQKKDCLTLLEGEYEVLEERQSAFKDGKRPIFESIKLRIKSGSVQNLVCWDLDRLFRNRHKLIQFFQFCKMYGCKIHSFNQGWLEQLNSIPEPFNEIMHDLMLQVMGWLAEEESKKKSERVRIAIRKDGNITKSYKGKLWGHHSLSKKVDEEIIDLHKQGKKLREIKELVSYWDKNNNKRFVSLGYVHKILSKFKRENISKSDVQEVTNI
jgi:DNA invertase Pin-like site-specific DNA recombinase